MKGGVEAGDGWGEWGERGGVETVECWERGERGGVETCEGWGEGGERGGEETGKGGGGMTCQRWSGNHHRNTSKYVPDARQQVTTTVHQDTYNRHTIAPTPVPQRIVGVWC